MLSQVQFINNILQRELSLKSHNGGLVDQSEKKKKKKKNLEEVDQRYD